MTTIPRKPPADSPEVNARYRKNGFDFVVDEISNGQVHVRRWQPEVENSCRWITVSSEVWDREMADVERVDAKGAGT